MNENDFKKFVVCPDCHSLYNFSALMAHKKDQEYVVILPFLIIHMSRRQPCKARLLAEVQLKSGKKQYYSRKYFCYKPLTESLSMLARRVGFLKHCELWRLRERVANAMCDIYDGKVWEEFQYVNGTPFLESRQIHCAI